MSKTLIATIVGVCSLVAQSHAQISGCTDPQANNYNASATINDGSCTYGTTNITLGTKTDLATPLLDESSGVEFLGGQLWTHNDSGNSNDIYRVDTSTNTVFQTVNISNSTNVDWEDITSSDDYLFVGDFGNNNGNRQDLKIYRINKTDLTPGATSVTAAIINFSFSDQVSFPSLPNNNNYDCESMIFYNDSIHLFSKDWVDKQTRHYVLPNVPGTHVAQVRETLNAGYLVTGATVQKGGVIALVGYDNTGFAPIFIYMLYDYKNGLFFNGNKRKFSVSNALVYGQVEGIDFFNAAYGYISNERFSQGVVVPPRLKSFNLGSYLPNAFVYPKPDANFTASATTICKLNSVTFTDLSTNDPTSWQWSFPGGTPATSTSQNPVITYNTTGTYSVTLYATNATGTDTLIKTSYIKVNALPTATISAGGPTTFCTGGSVLLTANTGTGLTYQWKKNTTVLAGATSNTYTATATGNYRTIITNSNGCSRISNTIAVVGPPSTGITVTGSLDLCPGDSVKFEVPSAAGTLYQWKKNNVNISGAVNNYYYASSAGVYKVVVTNSSGCSKTSGTKTVTTNCRVADTFSDASEEFSIYPNPSSGNFNLTSENLSDFEIQVYDLAGKEVEKFNVTSSNQFAFGENLLPGFYLCQIISNGKKEILKLIKSEAGR